MIRPDGVCVRSALPVCKVENTAKSLSWVYQEGENPDKRKGRGTMATRRMAFYADYGRKARESGQAYVYGSAVRKPEVLPARAPIGESEHRQKTSSQVLKNRRRALSINAAYVFFLTAAAITAVVICFLYLSLQSDTVKRSENITALQKELAELTEKNDAAFQAAEDSVDLQEIWDRAVNELGMVYASQGRVVPYENPTNDCVKQYNDIPENGVLAKSGSPKE